MIRLLLFVFIFSCGPFLSASNKKDNIDASNAGRYSKDAQKFGTGKLSGMHQLFNSKSPGNQEVVELGFQKINMDDFLPKEDRGKRLDPEAAEKKSQTQDFIGSSLEKDLEGFVQSSDDAKEFEGSESLFSLSRGIMDDPSSQSGILTKPAKYIPDTDSSETCIEPGVYQTYIKMNLHVDVKTKQIPEKIWVCQGHHIEKDCKNSKKADEFRKSKLKEFRENINVIESSVEGNVVKLGPYKRQVSIRYKHKERVPCDQAHTEEHLVDQSYEEDRWEPEDEAFYNNLTNSSYCKLISETPLSFADTRVVEGKPVYRERWSKRLCFNCGAAGSPECQKLRDSKGTLVGKVCLSETPQGQCESWEKTYEMQGLKKSLQEREVLANAHDLWGIDGEFDDTYEKNRDFGEVLATISTLTDVKDEIKNHAEDLGLETRVFAGRAFKCKKNYLNNVFYDCCGKLDGGLIKMNFVDCNSEEKHLQKAREEGRVVWIEKQKNVSLEGWTETCSYCVFPTRLSRVVQEHARKKFAHLYSRKKPWGTLKKPNCSGISLEQLTSLNFEEIDLSEVIGELKGKITQSELSKKLNRATQSISSENMQKKAEEAMQRMPKMNSKIKQVSL